ncbi:unnamed protein product, partial [Cyprideis torosa]
QNGDLNQYHCKCKDSKPVCGSNNVTYRNICAMREESFDLDKDEKPTLQNWGPCREAPRIITPPETIKSQLKSQVALGCEAKGWPVPTIHWEAHGPDGFRLRLPSDSPRIAVLQRGGPEPMMISGWVQLMDVTPDDSGKYTCVAVNEMGSAEATGELGVYKGWHEEENEVWQY